MPQPARQEVTIMPAPPELRQAALELAFREVPAEKRAPHVARLLAAAGRGELELDLLLVAVRGPDLLGAVWGQVQPGRVASLWPAVVSRDEATDCADALVADAVRRLSESGARIAQVLLAGDTRDQMARLRRNGFTYMADLLYMSSAQERFPALVPPGPLAFDSFAASDTERLGAIIERTYEGTLDCPQLNGVRALDDVLAGYRACGVFDPTRWFIVRRDERDIGCLLLTDHPEEDHWEIVYAGLAPAERGRGFGLAMVRHAQALTCRAGRARLMLAVDAANAPAVATYEAAGLIVWDRRIAMLRVFPDGGSAL
jgi:ribosomal protein S18 acetylase RimI-like enzyme